MTALRTEEETTTILMALIAWGGSPTAASKYLKAEKGINIPVGTLHGWKQSHGAQYDQLREKYAAQLEGNLVHEMRDVARLAVEAERLAIEKAVKRLEDDEDQDPARTAANLAKVSGSSTEKVLSLSGRPTQITETRDVGAILRSLAARGVLELPAAEEPNDTG